MTDEEIEIGHEENVQQEMLDVSVVMNQEQYEAVTKPLGTNVQVLAGPGTGKTLTLVNRVLYLLSKGVPPNSILVLTYTNRAIYEFRTRLNGVLGQELGSRLRIHTVHSYCQDLLMRHGQLIGLPEVQIIANKLDKEYIEGIVIRKIQNMHACKDYKEAKRLFHAALDSKLNKRSLSPVLESLKKDVLEIYNEELHKAFLFDYDDLIILTEKLLIKFPEVAKDLDSVLVDEFQDISQPLWNVIKRLAIHSSLYVAGDPDQNIFGFLGAHSLIFKEMRNAFKVDQVILTRSYRSSQPILDAAYELISHDKQREHSKKLVADESYLSQNMIENTPPRLIVLKTATDEMDWVSCTARLLMDQGVPANDIVVLARTGRIASEIADPIQHGSGARTIVIGGTSLLETEEASVCNTILRFLQYPNRNLFVLNLIRRYRLFITPKDLDMAISKAAEEGVSLIDVFRDPSPWITSAKREKLNSFLEMIDRSHDIMRENPQSLENVIEALRYCLGKLQLAEKVRLKYTRTYRKRMRNIDKFIEYLYSIKDYVAWELESHPERTFLEQLLASSVFYHITPTVDELVISTVHAAKGREWRVVFIVNADDKVYPHMRTHGSPKELNEERRVLYVAMTRAKERLLISYHKESPYNTFTENTPSRFFTKPVLNKFEVTKGTVDPSSVYSNYALAEAKYPLLFKQPQYYSTTVKKRFHTLARPTAPTHGSIYALSITARRFSHIPRLMSRFL